MKIDLLHYSAPPVVGGVESVIGHHARLMASAGHSVRLLAGRGESNDPRTPVIDLPLADSRHPRILEAKRLLDQGHLPEDFEALTGELASQLQEITNQTDILIAHNVCSLHKNLALTAALHRLGRSSTSLHTILWHHDLAWTTPRYRSELHEGYPWDLLRQDWPFATQVVVSELRHQELSDLINVPASRVVVVPNGLDIRQFLKLEDQTFDFIRQLDLLAAAPLLLLPVRITPRKNIELALQIMAALQVAYPAARLVITGPMGPHNPANIHYFNQLKKLRDELHLQVAVHFLAEITPAYLPDEVISDFYHLADGLILPSREEGFGIPILEAGISGLPIFCSDIPPLRSIAGDNAVYFQPDANPGQVAELINRYLSADMVYPLRIEARVRYTWEKVYQEQIEPLLRNPQVI